MRYAAVIFFVGTLGVASTAAFAGGGDLTPPLNAGATGVTVPTGGNQPLTGRSTVVEPAPAPGVVVVPGNGTTATDVDQSGTSGGGAKAGVGGMGSAR